MFSSDGHANTAGSIGDSRWTDRRRVDSLSQELFGKGERLLGLTDQNGKNGAGGFGEVKSETGQACKQMIAIAPQPRAARRMRPIKLKPALQRPKSSPSPRHLTAKDLS